MKLPRNEWILRFLLVIGAVFAARFLFWFYSVDRIGWFPLYVPVIIAITYKLLRLFFEWYHFAGLTHCEPKTTHEISYSVDVLTTAVPGEPISMIEESLRAMVAIRYPHTTYLCDEGDDPRLIEICEELGVVHVTRQTKENAKAGNINNALGRASGEITVIFDPDHVPPTDFLDLVLPYFGDPDIGYVQGVQMYSNVQESWISEAAAQQTYMFYGPIMQAMGRYGTAQAIGANCAFRRAALDSIGGHASGLTEDMHTSMLLHAKGWKSVYVPQAFTKGLVPENTSGYFKQQLKWSRGSFELYFQVLPHVFHKLNWRQKLHYTLLPLHFAIGLIVLLDLAVPILSLFTGRYPMLFEPREAIMTIVPFLLSIIAIKLYAQRWLIMEDEAGLQIKGGTLLFATWWTYLKGFVYSIVKITVPYLPTPKKDGYANNFRDLIPNLVFIILGLAALIYSLFTDWDLYTWVMGSFVVINTLMLLVVFLFSQQLFMTSLRNGLSPHPGKRKWAHGLTWFKEHIHKPLFRLSLRASVFFAFLAIALFSGMKYVDATDKDPRLHRTFLYTPFYFGIYMPQIMDAGSLPLGQEWLAKMGPGKKIISYYIGWNPDATAAFPKALVQAIGEQGNIPMITWEPYVSGFPASAEAPWLTKDSFALKAIAEGKFDFYIKDFAINARKAGIPILLRFAHEYDNQKYPWSSSGGNTAEDFKAAWKVVHKIFREVGAHNVIWVWTPLLPQNMDAYYPGPEYVDWIGLTMLNYGQASEDARWRSLEDLYHPFRSKVLKLNKPVLFAEFCTTNYGGDQAAWFQQAFLRISKDYGEVRGVVLFNSDQDSNWITGWRPGPGVTRINWKIQPELFNPHLQRFMPDMGSVQRKADADTSVRTHFFRLNVEGQPFQVKGVAYNIVGDIKRGGSREAETQIARDMADIRATGANTITLYHPSVWDDVILKQAGHFGLKLVYGFWFDPTVDYSEDVVQKASYFDLVRKQVSKYKNKRSIIMWNLANGGLEAPGTQYAEPYRAKVRRAYADMIDSMASMIHSLDSGSIVIASIPSKRQTPALLWQVADKMRSVDVIGLHVSDEPGMVPVDSIFNPVFGNKPFLYTELTAGGKWNQRDGDAETMLDRTDVGRGWTMVRQWKAFASGGNGRSLGGVFFCWRDQPDRSINLTGLTDQEGRKKFGYYVARHLWKGVPIPKGWPIIQILGPYASVHAGTQYQYRLIHPDQRFSDYTWTLYAQNASGENGKLEVSADGQSVQLTTPAVAGSYQLNVRAADQAGRVVTASRQVIVAGNQINPGLKP